MYEKTIVSPVKAIRAKCLDCCCGQQSEVKICEIDSCPLWSFRFGKNPHRKKRELTEEQKEAIRIRFQNNKNKHYEDEEGDFEDEED